LDIADFAVIGAGPVGLHAALKAALLNHSAIVLDAGNPRSRVYFVPRITNIPAMVEPLSGRELLKRQRAALAARAPQVQIYDNTKVMKVKPDAGRFVLECNILKGKEKVGANEYVARCVIMATGAVDRQVLINGAIRLILP